MLSTTDLKYWWRSGSFSFMRDRAGSSADIGSVEWNGKPLYYRKGSSDLELIYRVLLKPEHKREYRLPSFAPRTILDIGANIGVTSVLMARHFPDATIHAFEPVASNVELLRRNVAVYPRVRVHAVGLGAQDATLSIRASDNPSNFGGYSLFEAGTDAVKKVPITVREVNSFLSEIGVERVDLIKIDTEGAEYPILKQLAPELLSRAQWITGELHGNQDFALLDYLSQWFDVAVSKSLGNRLSTFEARNRT